MGHGHLGQGLARQRPCWDFGGRHLGPAMPNLLELVRCAESLVSLTFPLTSGGDDEQALGREQPQAFATFKMPDSLSRSFRSARVRGGITGPLIARRVLADPQDHGRLDPPREPEGSWQPLVPDEGGWRLPNAWFEEDVNAVSVELGCGANGKVVRRGHEKPELTFDQGDDTQATLAAIRLVEGAGTAQLDEALCAQLLAPISPPSDSSPLWRQVTLQGLQARPELNGRCGVVTAFDRAAGRWLVTLSVRSGSVEAPAGARVKPANLRIEPPDEPSTMWAALARHAGSARWVDALVTQAPQLLGPPALRATLHPGLAHLARRLLALTAADGTRCIQLESVTKWLLEPRQSAGGESTSVWQVLALDDGAESAAVVDELLARVDALRPSVYELLTAALAAVDKPSVALRIASMHWQGRIDAAPLLEIASAGEGGEHARSGEGGGEGDGAYSTWFRIGLREGSGELADHLIDRVPALRETSIAMVLEAIRRHKYAVVSRLVRNGIIDHPRFEAEVVSVLLDRTQPLPYCLYRPKKRHGGASGGAGGGAGDGGGDVNQEADNAALFASELFQRLAPRHRAHFAQRHSPWTLMLLDSECQPLTDTLLGRFASLRAAALSAETLLLALVPVRVEQAQRLFGIGAKLDTEAVQTLLQPAEADGVSAWRRLQLDTDSRRVVDRLMLSERRLGETLGTFLAPEHAARAADLLEAAGPRAVAAFGLEGGLTELLRSSASDEVLRGMSWQQAVGSAGAVVLDSPHPYPDRATIHETVSIPNAAALYVAFHPLTRTERGHDIVRLRWSGGRTGPMSGTGFPGIGSRPPLRIEADSFELHFVSDDTTHFWGFRLVAWSEGPADWCRFAALMMHDAKDSGRLCRRLVQVVIPPLPSLALPSQRDAPLPSRLECAVTPRASTPPLSRACHVLSPPPTACHVLIPPSHSHPAASFTAARVRRRPHV